MVLQMMKTKIADAVADVEEEIYLNDTDDVYELFQHDLVI